MAQIRKLKIDKNTKKRNVTSSRFLVDLKVIEKSRFEQRNIAEESESDQANFGRYAKVKHRITKEEVEDNQIFANEKVEEGGEEKSRQYKRLLFFIVLKSFCNLASRLGQVVVGPIQTLFSLLTKEKNAPTLYGIAIDRASERNHFDTKIELIPRSKKLLRFITLPRFSFSLPKLKRRASLKSDLRKQDMESFVCGEPKERASRLYLVNFRSALIFGVIMAVFVLPLKSYDFYEFINKQKGKVLGISEEAVANLFVATTNASNLDFSQARLNFQKAELGFQEIEKKVGNWKVLLNILGKILPGEKIQIGASVDNILRAGEAGSNIGGSLSHIMIALNDEKTTNKEKILLIEKYIYEVEENTILFNHELERISPEIIPEEYREIFLNLRNKSILIEDMFPEVFELIDALEVFSGFEFDKRYLLVFQNNTEMRASGGFIGSFAILDLANGEIKNIEIPSGGSYDLQGGMYERVVAPEPLQLVNPQWYFWDANWWSDWPLSASKLEWFLDKSQGPSVDGVISFTPTVMELVLEVLGPVELGGEYNLKINKDNFWDIVQTFSEQKPLDHPDYRPNVFLPENSASSSMFTTSPELEKTLPKKIIGDIFPVLMAKIKTEFDKDLAFDFLKILEKSFLEKQILLYFNDDNLQALVDEKDWSGRIRETEYDYLQIVNTNIAGGKTDKAIVNKYNLQTEIKADGSIENTLVIKRVHNGVVGQRFRGARNVDWLRVYVPEGAELIFAEGFSAPDASLFEKPDEDWIVDEDVQKAESISMTHQGSGTKVYHELGKTVFANWAMVDPGESSRITLKYRLPFKISKEVNSNELLYMLTWQKQPGSLDTQIYFNISYPEQISIVDSGGQEECVDKICALDIDRYWYYIFE